MATSGLAGSLLATHSLAVCVPTGVAEGPRLTPTDDVPCGAVEPDAADSESHGTSEGDAQSLAASVTFHVSAGAPKCRVLEIASGDVLPPPASLMNVPLNDAGDVEIAGVAHDA